MIQLSSKLENQLEVLSMLNVLITANFSLMEAIEVMSVKYDLKLWIEQLEQGDDFYQVLLSNDYDPDVLLIVKIGLRSEEFKITVGKTVDILKRKIEKRAELIELIKYPIMIIGIAIVSTFFLTIFMIPQFERILSSMGVQSKATETIYRIFKFGPYLLGFIIILTMLITIIILRLPEKKRIEMIIKIKPLKMMYVPIYNQLFVVTIANLLKTNLHLSEVVDVLINQSENIVLASEAKKIKQGVKRGKYIYECITPPLYDESLLQALKIGEETGMLGYYLNTYSMLICSVNEKREKKILFWIQPIFYLIFGALILLLYAAIFIPMFSLMDSI